MPEQEFPVWFDQNSGYALHPWKTCRLSGCCAASIEETGRFVWLPTPERPPGKYPLCRCPQCEKLYAKSESGFVLITNPLKYRIT